MTPREAGHRAAPTLARMSGAVIGQDAPLDPTGRLSPTVERRAVNPRWLLGAVFVAVGGGGLIGSAVFASLDREAVFAEQAVRATPLPATSGTRARARKGDKLVVAADIAASRQSFKAPTTLRVGEREIIRSRAFTRVATNLTLRAPDLAADIPAFNPLRLIADGANDQRFAEAEPSEAEADVSVVKRQLASLTLPGGGPTLSDADVEVQIDAQRRMVDRTPGRVTAGLPLPDLLVRRALATTQGVGATGLLGFAAPETRFSSIEVRMAPENVTTIGRSAPEAAPAAFDERVVATRRGETFEQVLRAQGVSADQIKQIVAVLGGRSREVALAEGQRVRFLLQKGARLPARPQDKPQDELLRVMIYGEEAIEAIAAVDDRGQFVSVAPPQQQPAQQTAAGDEDEEEGSGPSLYQSIYETALKNEVPRGVIDELVRVFAYDVDFQRRAQGGDHLEVLLSRDDEADADRAELLFASLSSGGETRRFYRFTLNEDGAIDYFDEQGRSAKKFLLRKPLSEGTFRSPFGFRRHPIHGYSKMHTGVDWSDRVGTPIFASGNGTVIKAEWDSGYGRRVEIQHANGYVTSYSHMSGFARGIQPGARTRQGEVIGFVGNSGLSTGPHLHYEVIVNGHFVDPLRIRLPRGRELDGRQLAEFKRERERVDGLRARAANPTRVAQGEQPR